MAQRGAFDVKPSSFCSDDFVHLDDDAVDFVGELFALRIPAFDVALDFVQRVAELPVLARLELHR